MYLVVAIWAWPPTTEVRVHAQVSPCGICGGQQHWDSFPASTIPMLGEGKRKFKTTTLYLCSPTSCLHCDVLCKYFYFCNHANCLLQVAPSFPPVLSTYECLFYTCMK
jgi:hypothetical protein